MIGISSEFRRRLWHLRHGGVKGIRESMRRGYAERGIYMGTASGARAIQIRRGRRRATTFNDYQLPEIQPRTALKVAVILDDFSLAAWGREWHQNVISPDGWAKELEQSPPDMLFVESAWAGNNGQWQYHLTGASGPSQQLRDLVEYCRTRGIPSVFWNKEDPPHYQDFIDTARLFDFVFTSDANKIASYIADLGHNRVDVLQFAAQPDFHNPSRPNHGWHERDIAFAGMFFAHKYPERREQMQILLGAAREVGSQMKHGLEIFARHASKDLNYRFPPPFDEHVVGSLTYQQMLTAYKAYKIFLNVNSVVDSPSMCARRIFEITASGTTVLSTPSVALTSMWSSDEQFIVSDQASAQETLTALCVNPELSARQLHRAQRKIWQGHTYAHRVQQISEKALPEVSIDARRVPSQQQVSLIVSSNRPHQLEHVFRTVGGFCDVDVELVLTTHGFVADPERVSRWSAQYGVDNLVLIDKHASSPLGDCLNAGVAAANGQVLSKLDDDDVYSPNYLADLLYSLEYSRAEVVGKQAHYMYLSDSKATLLRFPEREHRYTNMVMGPTITGRREVFRDIPFAEISRGEDTQFLRSVSEAGGKIYSADKYNYAQFRGSVNHAWGVSDAYLMTTGNIAFFGTPHEHVEI